jgi:uncharacterized protein (DUF952 family)
MSRSSKLSRASWNVIRNADKSREAYKEEQRIKKLKNTNKWELTKQRGKYMFSKKQLVYFLHSMYKHNAVSKMTFKESGDLWEELITMDYEDLESLLEENAESVLELFPDIEEKLNLL